MIARRKRSPDESDQMVEVMKTCCDSVEYIVKVDEDYGFHNEENRIDFTGS